MKIQEIKNLFSDFKKEYFEKIYPSRDIIEEAERKLLIVEDFIQFIEDKQP